jgi:hypothetical protein
MNENTHDGSNEFCNSDNLIVPHVAIIKFKPPANCQSPDLALPPLARLLWKDLKIRLSSFVCGLDGVIKSKPSLLTRHNVALLKQPLWLFASTVYLSLSQQNDPTSPSSPHVSHTPNASGQQVNATTLPCLTNEMKFAHVKQYVSSGSTFSFSTFSTPLFFTPLPLLPLLPLLPPAKISECPFIADEDSKSLELEFNVLADKEPPTLEFLPLTVDFDAKISECPFIADEDSKSLGLEFNV